MSMNRPLPLLTALLIVLSTAFSAFAQDLSITEDMINRYLAVYERMIASSPEAAFRLFHNEEIAAESPESAMAEEAIRQAGFESRQEFVAADVTIGTAWLQLAAEDMAESAERTKREAVEAIEDALADSALKDSQRAELEKALEQMQREGPQASTASDTDFVDPAGMKLLRAYRERLEPVMTMESGDQLRGF